MPATSTPRRLTVAALGLALAAGCATAPAAGAAASPAAASPAAASPAATAPAFSYSVHRVTAASLGPSWHSGCPVGPAHLRAIVMTYWGFDRTAHSGRLIVNADAVTTVVGAFRAIYAARFPIRTMHAVSYYGGSDDTSMAADNTSAFNCRQVSGSTSWSEHAYGRAVDVNPVENPYVHGGQVEPPAGERYLDRSNVRRGMAEPGNALVGPFTRRGWGWGGTWHYSKDYQHFSATGT